MAQFERTIYNLFENLKRQVLAQPLNLGGVTASGGGAGGPPGGFIGVLPQYRIAFDESEEAIWDIPGSGVPLPSGQSLLINLDRIRYRLEDLEAGSGISSISIQEDDVDVGNATVLNFEGNVVVTDEGSNKITVLVSGGQPLHLYGEDLTGSSGTGPFTVENIFISETLRVYYSGLRQGTSYYTESPATSSFTTDFVVASGNELTVDYNYYVAASGIIGWGNPLWGVTIYGV